VRVRGARVRVRGARLTCLIRDQVPGRDANGTDPLREQGVIGSWTQRRGPARRTCAAFARRGDGSL